MSNNIYDLLIIGAGLAGLSVAEAALEYGNFRTAVLDSKGAGSNRTTPLTFVDTLKDFDLYAAARMRYNRFTFCSPRGTRSTHVFEGEPLASLDYQHACQIMLERTKARHSLELIAGAATSIQHLGNEGWWVETSHGRRLFTRLLVDASGSSFFTARCLGLPVPRVASHSYGLRLKNCNPVENREAFFVTPSQDFGGGGGWFYPLEDGRASYGVAVLRSTNQPFAGADLKVLLHRALIELQPFADWIKGSQVEEVEWGTIPIFPVRRFIFDQLLQVGDSAGQATCWSCMGSEMALVSGQMAGEVAGEALCNDYTSARGLKNYERRWRARFGRIFFQAEQLSPLVYAQEDKDWDRNLEMLQRLTPEQMLARLRSNWPQLPFWQLAWIVWYDRAGRARRRMAHAMSSLFSTHS